MEPTPLQIERQPRTLTAQDLSSLFSGQILAIRLPAFCPSEICRIMASRLVEHPGLAYYPHAPAIGKVMDAFYEGHSDPENRERYYQGVNQANIDFRNLSAPYLNPLDHLRLMLDEIWPAGARRENIHGKPMACGLAQFFKAGAEALPHQDFLRMDEPDNERAQTLTTQITALVYIQPAVQGGHLQLWSEHYGHDEFMARRNLHTYGLNRDRIAPFALDLRPGLGDLIMADSTKVHAVTPVEEGIRIAVNCFLGFRGPEEPITYWS